MTNLKQRYSNAQQDLIAQGKLAEEEVSMVAVKLSNNSLSAMAKGGYVYRESDDEDATEYLTKSEAMEFIDEHNEGFKTNYKSIEDFNKGEQLENGIRSIEKIKMAILGLLLCSCAPQSELRYIIIENNNSIDVWASDHFTITDTAIYIK